MDLLLDRSFQRSVPLKVATLKSGKKSDPSPYCTDIGPDYVSQALKENLFLQTTAENHLSGMSGEFNVVKRDLTTGIKRIQGI